MKQIEEKPETIDNDQPLLKPKRKMKKFPRSEKQQEAFKKTMEKRAENIERRKQQKKIEAAKLLLEQQQQQQQDEKSSEAEEETKKPKKKPKKIILPESDSDLNTSDSTEEDESDSEMYKQYIKSKKKPKADKIKRVYILKKEEVLDSDSDYEPPIISKPKKNFKSQQNKKSVIKITENPVYIPNVKNYFCD